MEQRIKPDVLRLAADIIQKKGAAHQDGYLYDQVKLVIEPEGYTMSSSNQTVIIHLYCPNKIGINCKSLKETEAFYDHLLRISQQ